ncbi:energy-coupling factor transporter transmembrane protein EcfT [Clostridium bornimense]|uniref:energy-coupling factor transporter transmembrane component T family protein n=1 Tax=Clostridium bornimense TaxID=1216932 RepID=UPI001C0FFD8E|nr:energy-coupling factor transporter transmembrane component T [Clostridium bornimense]MBU5315709.1 energy-coupling factor transporter transmembrane protein EcfT [Clostridium bornimense]
MGDLSKAIYNIRKIDELGKEDTIIHKINPMIKIIVTLAYVIKVISIKEFLFEDIIVILAYSIFIFIFAKIPVNIILRKLIFVLPVVLGVITINLIIDFSYKEIIYSLLLLFKCTFSLIGTLQLLATTTINDLALAMKKLKVPKVLISTLLMIYRYILVLMEEGYRIKSAYQLRTMGKKSMTISDWGIIMGRLLLRTIDRSEQVYSAMIMRGFHGEYYSGEIHKVNSIDLVYCFVIIGIFILF